MQSTHGLSTAVANSSAAPHDVHPRPPSSGRYNGTVLFAGPLFIPRLGRLGQYPRQYEVPVQDDASALGPGLDRVRIGVLREGFGGPGAEPDVDAAVRETLEPLAAHGASVTEVSVPDHLTARALHRGLVAEGLAALLQGNGMGYHWRGSYNANVAIAFGKGLQTVADDLPPNVKLLTMVGTYLRQHYHGRLYAKAQNLRPSFRAHYDAVLSEVDVLAMPTTPMKAHRHDPDLDLQQVVGGGGNITSNTVAFDVTGHPAISLPCTLSKGLPVGLMLVGRHFDDAGLLAIAHAVEQRIDCPPVAAWKA